MVEKSLYIFSKNLGKLIRQTSLSEEDIDNFCNYAIRNEIFNEEQMSRLKKYLLKLKKEKSKAISI